MFKEVNARNVDHVCNDLFPNRWSPRAMSGEALSDEEIDSLFEAARWAPSCMNSQPWRFLYAKKNTPHWEIFFKFLVDGNWQDDPRAKERTPNPFGTCDSVLEIA